MIKRSWRRPDAKESENDAPVLPAADQPSAARGHAAASSGGTPNDDRSSTPHPANSVSNQPGGSTDNPEAKKKQPINVKALDIAVPKEIGRYTIGRRIGSGTCGVVHHSLDNLLGREVAVKLSPVGEAHVSTGKVPGAQRAYQTEIVVAGKLTHPNIVTVYDAGQFDDLNYLVMEVVEGKSLKEYGKGKTTLPASEALRIICACCEGLDYSHRQGILHRDIKPANIMLAHDGGVKVLDYGIAVGLGDDSALQKKGPTLGTPNYMSPEQILGRELTARSDFYSLATVLFELLTGRQLFKAKKVKDLFRIVVYQKAPRLTSIRPDLPEGLADVVAKALEKKPHLRFGSGAEMAEALKPFLVSFQALEKRPLAQQRLIRQLRRQTFFKNFSDLEVALLLDHAKFKSFSANQTVLAAGHNDRRLLIVTDGMVSGSLDGSLSLLVGAGECVGEPTFIDGSTEPRHFSALTDVSAIEFSVDDLSALPSDLQSRYLHYISEVMKKRAENTDNLVIDVSL